MMAALSLGGCRWIAGYDEANSSTAVKDGGGVENEAGQILPEGGVVPASAMPRLMGGAGDDVAHAVAVDAQGNVYVVGETRSPTFQLGDGGSPLIRLPDGPGSSSDLFIVSIDPQGATRWAHRIGGTGDSLARDVAVCGESVVVVGESSASVLTSVSRIGGEWQLTRGNGSGRNLVVLALDAIGGGKAWGHSDGGEGQDSARNVACAEDRLFVSGTTNSLSRWSLAGFAPEIQGGLGGVDFFVAGLDVGGKVTSHYRVGGSGDDVSGALHVYPNAGDLVLWHGGHSTSTDWVGPELTEGGLAFVQYTGVVDTSKAEFDKFGGNGDDRWVALTNAATRPVGAINTNSTDWDGVPLAGQGIIVAFGSGPFSILFDDVVLDGPAEEVAFDLASTGPDHVIVVGRSDSSRLGNLDLLSNDGADALVAGVVTTGVVSALLLGSTSDDAARGVVVSPLDGRLYVVGEIGQPLQPTDAIDLGDGSAMGPLGGKDAFVTLLEAP